MIAAWKLYRMGRDGIPYNHMGLVISSYDRLPPTIQRYPWTIASASGILAPKFQEA